MKEVIWFFDFSSQLKQALISLRTVPDHWSTHYNVPKTSRHYLTHTLVISGIFSLRRSLKVEVIFMLDDLRYILLSFESGFFEKKMSQISLKYVPPFSAGMPK